MTEKPKIPRCMSTQHPDNVNSPFFAENTELGGEDEVQEAYYAFSHLGCDEQMWDCEGKEVDNYLVKKLLSKYEFFFRERKLGKDIFITLRVPNPTIEKAEAKIVIETLESIPRSFDAANLFYKDSTPPIFEVILPMTSSAKCIDRIYRYYRDFVIGKQDKSFGSGDIKIREWIGDFMPEKINVIPLFEDMPHMLDAHAITREYMKGKDSEYQRVFLARSDPAVNYGNVSAVLLNKIALQRLHALSGETGVKIYPIIGVGSAPFRGNLKPSTVERVTEEYPSVQTFTIQSAFKYDYPSSQVTEAVSKLSERKVRQPQAVDEARCLEIIRKYSDEYRKQVVGLAGTINAVSKHVPSRRKRKLHIGLFGYSREVEKISLPRAIPFTSALYSVGLPPEILGLNALSEAELQFVSDAYVHFESDLKDALRYFNPATPFLPKGLGEKVKAFLPDFETDEEHRKMTDHIIDILGKHKTNNMNEYILRAAHLRRFLG
jgi:phosphoenolpyruvate carboxylase